MNWTEEDVRFEKRDSWLGGFTTGIISAAGIVLVCYFIGVIS